MKKRAWCPLLLTATAGVFFLLGVLFDYLFRIGVWRAVYGNG